MLMSCGQGLIDDVCIESVVHAWSNLTLHKKWSFPFRISSVNVTKYAGNCGNCISGYKHIFYSWTSASKPLINIGATLILLKHSFSLLLWQNTSLHCVKSAQIRSYFWSEYRKIRNRNNSTLGHFSRSAGKNSSMLLHIYTHAHTHIHTQTHTYTHKQIYSNKYNLLHLLIQHEPKNYIT